MGDEQVVAGEALGRKMAADVAVNDVKIAKRPEVEVLQLCFVDQSERWFKIAQFVGACR